MDRYTVEIGGAKMRTIEIPCKSIAAGRKLAEEYGNTADFARINDHDGRYVARHQRYNNGDGMAWFAVCL